MEWKCEREGGEEGETESALCFTFGGGSLRNCAKMEHRSEIRGDCKREREKEREGTKGSKRNGDKAPSWEELSKLFHLPVEAAAKELGIGLTPMKANCRELGLRRWPYRRIKSLQNLIRYYEVPTLVLSTWYFLLFVLHAALPSLD